jgi:hypothetical protein
LLVKYKKMRLLGLFQQPAAGYETILFHETSRIFLFQIRVHDHIFPHARDIELSTLAWESQKVSQRSWDIFEDMLRREWDACPATIAGKK